VVQITNVRRSSTPEDGRYLQAAGEDGTPPQPARRRRYPIQRYTVGPMSSRRSYFLATVFWSSLQFCRP